MMYMSDLNKGCMENKNVLNVWTILMTRCSLHMGICRFCNQTRSFIYRSGVYMYEICIYLNTNWMFLFTFFAVSIITSVLMLLFSQRTSHPVKYWWRNSCCICRWMKRLNAHWHSEPLLTIKRTLVNKQCISFTGPNIVVLSNILFLHRVFRLHTM